jgi:Fe2+ or Zn2+ uptake regulation protein
LSEKQRIEVLMMIGYGDRAKTHQEVCQLFREKYPDQPINQSTISRIENKFRKHGVVKNLSKTGRPVTLNEDAQLDVLLEIENNPHSTSRSIALDHKYHNISPT